MNIDQSFRLISQRAAIISTLLRKGKTSAARDTWNEMKALIEELGPEEKSTSAFEFWLDKMWNLYQWIVNQERATRHVESNPRKLYKSVKDQYWFDKNYYSPSEHILYITLRGIPYKAHHVSPYYEAEIWGRRNKHDVLVELQERYDLIPQESNWCQLCDKNEATVIAELTDIGYVDVYTRIICSKCRNDIQNGINKEITIVSSRLLQEDLTVKHKPVRGPRVSPSAVPHKLPIRNPREPVGPVPWYVSAAASMADQVYGKRLKMVVSGGHIVGESTIFEFAYNIFDDNENFRGIIYSTEVKGLVYSATDSHYLRICRGSTRRNVIYQKIIDDSTTKEEFQGYVEHGLPLLDIGGDR